VTRRRRAAALAAAGLLGLGSSACGGSGSRTAAAPPPGSGQGLQWAAAPQVFRPRGLLRDRILLGRIVNDGPRTLELRSSEIVLRDAGGRRIPGATGAFTASYAHGLFGALQQPSVLPPAELARLGRLISLQPATSTPFFAAWHLPARARQPVSVELGGSRLEVPEGARLTAR